MPKPGKSRCERQRRHRELRSQIHYVRELVFARDRRCRYCNGRRLPLCGSSGDQMHEEPSRAQTRGRPPEERFNTKICVRVCPACHTDLTAHRLGTIFADSSLGYDGEIQGYRIGGTDHDAE